MAKKSIPSQGLSHSSSFQRSKNPELQNLPDTSYLNDPVYRPQGNEKYPNFGKPLRVTGRFQHSPDMPGTPLKAYGGNVDARQLEDKQFFDTAQALRDSGVINKKQFIGGLKKYKQSKRMRGVI